MLNFIGKSLGRYHILEKLGEGGMAVVYKAYDTHLEREVAVKVIRRSAFSPEVVERMLQRFNREAKALSKLTHANIVPIIDYGEYENNPYLVMPLISGGSLKDLLINRTFNWSEAVRVTEPVARALAYAHTRGILHRDVKPSNILLTESGDPMLTDFGVAKILEEGEGATLTGTGVGLGTPEYMAPEQWVGKAVTASDQYSLGIVLYEMITGRKPYSADTPAAVLLKQATEPLPRPKDLITELPDEVERILLKALAKYPQDRYQDLGEFAVALTRAERGGSFNTIGSSEKASTEPVIVDPLEDQHQLLTSKPLSQEQVLINTSFLVTMDEVTQQKESIIEPAVEMDPHKSSREATGKPAVNDLKNEPVKKDEVLQFVSSKKKLILGLIGLLTVLVLLMIILIPGPVDRFNGFFYTTYQDDNPQVYFLEKTGSTLNITDSVINANCFGPSRQFDHYVYYSCMVDRNTQIFRYDSKTRQIIQYTHSDTVDNWQPAPYQDGQLYFVSNRDGGTRIYRLSKDGRAYQALPSFNDVDTWDPAPSKDGKLFFTSNYSQARSEIFVLESGQIKQITNSTSEGYYGSWDPTPSSGGLLFFTSNRDFSHTEIYCLDKNGKVSRITQTPLGSSSWNPVIDNKGNVYFTSNRDGKIAIYYLDRNGVTRILNTPGNNDGRFPQADQLGHYNVSDSNFPSILTNTMITVPANVEWTNSGVMINNGDSFQIEASGEWSYGMDNSEGFVYSDGNGSQKYDAHSILPVVTVGTLLAKIGSCAPFFVGVETRRVSTCTGELFFSMNDVPGSSNFMDNVGQLEISIRFD